jgi:hypothetical protein
MLDEACLEYLLKYVVMRTRLNSLSEELRRVGQIGRKAGNTEVFSICHGMAHALDTLNSGVVSREINCAEEIMKEQALKGNTNV